MAKTHNQPSIVQRAVSNTAQAEAPPPTPTLEQWQAHAADLARRLAAAEARVAELEAPLRKQTYCFGPPGFAGAGAVVWRIAAVSEARARALLPPEAADAVYRGCA